MASWKCHRQDGGFSSQSRRRDDIIFVGRYRQYWGSAKAKSLRTIVDSNHYPDVKWGIKSFDVRDVTPQGILV